MIMYYALVHVSGKRVDFGNKSELTRWILQHRSTLNRANTLTWYLYRTEKTPYKFCNRLLSSCICSLNYYMSNKKLFYNEKEHQKNRFAVAPCGERL